mgnify:FL=1
MESDTALLEFYAAYLEYLPLKNPKKLFKCSTKIAEELGEVAEATSALDGNAKKIAKIAGEGQTPEERLSEELMDVVVCCLNLAHAAKLDPEAMFKSCTEKLRMRTQERIEKKLKKNPEEPSPAED